MNLETVIDKVGLSVASLQSQKVTKLSPYVSRYTRHNNIALKATFATKSDLSWDLTLVPTIQKQKGKYRITLGKQKSQNNLKNLSRKYSKLYDSIIDAEKDIFNFRLQCESNKSRTKVLKQIEELEALDNPIQEVQLTAETISSLSTSSSRCKKQREMLGNVSHISNDSVKSRNPNSSGQMTITVINKASQVNLRKIRNFLSYSCYIKAKEIFKKKFFDAFEKVQQQLQLKDTSLMIVDGNDEDYFASLSKHQLLRVREQAEHVHKALFFYMKDLQS